MKKITLLSAILLLAAACNKNVQTSRPQSVNKAEIKITSPLNAESWKAGQPYKITWTGGSSQVTIMLIDKSLESQGASVSKVWSDYNINNTGSYDFKVPDNLNGTFKFYIDDDTGNTAYSDYFNISKPADNVTYEQKMAACKAIPNGSTQNITDTTRLLINLPKDIYPDKDHNLKFATITGKVTSGSIAGFNGEPLPEAPGCWSYYNEFDGQGEVDLTVKSAISGMPDYKVKFIVK